MTIAMPSFEELTVGALCVWRVTHLLHAEDGPGRIFVRLRRSAGNFFGQVLDCFYCLSLWVAAPAAIILARDWKNGVVIWLAMSGAACLLERATREHHPLAGLMYEEPKEDSHVLRRSETEDYDRIGTR